MTDDLQTDPAGVTQEATAGRSEWIGGEWRGPFVSGGQVLQFMAVVALHRLFLRIPYETYARICMIPSIVSASDR